MNSPVSILAHRSNRISANPIARITQAVPDLPSPLFLNERVQNEQGGVDRSPDQPYRADKQPPSRGPDFFKNLVGLRQGTLHRLDASLLILKLLFRVR